MEGKREERLAKLSSEEIEDCLLYGENSTKRARAALKLRGSGGGEEEFGRMCWEAAAIYDDANFFHEIGDAIEAGEKNAPLIKLHCMTNINRDWVEGRRWQLFRRMSRLHKDQTSSSNYQCQRGAAAPRQLRLAQFPHLPTKQ